MNNMQKRYKVYSLFDKFYTLQRIYYDDDFYDYDFGALCMSIKHTLELNFNEENCKPYLSFLDVPIDKGAMKLWLKLNITKHWHFDKTYPYKNG